MHLMTRGENRRAMLAQLSHSQRGGQVNAEAIVSAFVEQLIALRESFERDIMRLQATLEADLAAAKRELKDLQSELDDREHRDRTSNITALRKPSDARNPKEAS